MKLEEKKDPETPLGCVIDWIGQGKPKPTPTCPPSYSCYINKHNGSLFGDFYTHTIP